MTHTLGTTPDDLITEAFRAQCEDGRYKIECHESSEEFRVLKEIVNQGIDAHLEAITGMREFPGEHGRRGFSFTGADMLVILRRLMEEGGEEELSLRVGILETLGLEEV